MSHSGIPVISQIGEGLAWLGHNGQDGGLGQTTAQTTALAPAPSGPLSPASPPTNSDPQVSQAENDSDKETGRGEAANMLTGGAGLNYNPPTARSVLLGS